MRYLHPYSPFLNPIENLFSVWKNLALKAACETEEELTNAISSSFSELSVLSCESFYMLLLENVGLLNY